MPASRAPASPLRTSLRRRAAEGGDDAAGVGRVQEALEEAVHEALGAGREAFSFDKGLTLENALVLKQGTIKVLGPDIMVTGIPEWK